MERSEIINDETRPTTQDDTMRGGSDAATRLGVCGLGSRVGI